MFEITLWQINEGSQCGMFVRVKPDAQIFPTARAQR